MRALAVSTLALLTLAGAATVAAAPGGATTTAPATVRVVTRPVTATGHVRAGFTLVGEPAGQVDCSFADPSPGAVNRNIEFCSPSSEYAIACWKAAVAHRVLCVRNPRGKRVYRIPRSGAFAPTALAPRRQRAPLAMNLGDGDHCSIRDGGTGAIRQGHPRWVNTYYCVHDGMVWQKPGAPHLGVNESSATWTVVTGGATGPLVTRRVARAWFVGTYFGG